MTTNSAIGSSYDMHFYMHAGQCGCSIQRNTSGKLDEQTKFDLTLDSSRNNLPKLFSFSRLFTEDLSWPHHFQLIPPNSWSQFSLQKTFIRIRRKEPNFYLIFDLTFPARSRKNRLRAKSRPNERKARNKKKPKSFSIILAPAIRIAAINSPQRESVHVQVDRREAKAIPRVARRAAKPVLNDDALEAIANRKMLWRI